MTAQDTSTDRRPPRDKLWILVLVVAAAGETIFALGPDGRAPLEAPFSWWTLAALFAAVELAVVHVEFRRSAHSFTLSEIPLVLGLCFVAPREVVLAQLAGAGAVLVANRHQSILKVSFNLAQFMLATSAATLMFHAFVPPSGPLTPSGWPAMFLATWTSSALGALAVLTAVAITDGSLRRDRLPLVLLYGFVVTAANTSLGLVAAQLYWHEPSAVALLVIPAVALFFAYRAHASEREQREGLQFLHAANHALQRSADVESAMVELLSGTRNRFRAQRAEFGVAPEHPGERLLRVVVGADAGPAAMESVEDDTVPAVIALLGDGGRARLLTRADPEPGVRAFLAARSSDDAMVALLPGDPPGFLVVAGRLGDVGSFSRADLRLFETLADQCRSALERGRLEESLRGAREREVELSHAAHHDPLTGLANRLLFTRLLADALGQDHGGGVAVLYVDLDGLKTVNDTHGHDAGDGLLREAARRMRSVLRPGDAAARLGGDEFAVLVTGVTAPDGPAGVARRVLETFSEPVVVGDLILALRASVGVAGVAAAPGDPDGLLRAADRAMYRAKAAGGGRYAQAAPGGTATLAS